MPGFSEKAGKKGSVHAVPLDSWLRISFSLSSRHFRAFVRSFLSNAKISQIKHTNEMSATQSSGLHAANNIASFPSRNAVTAKDAAVINVQMLKIRSLVRRISVRSSCHAVQRKSLFIFHLLLQIDQVLLLRKLWILSICSVAVTSILPCRAWLRWRRACLVHHACPAAR